MNILVTNLSINIISDVLSQLFSAYVEVSFVAVVRDRKSGRTKGSAFVEMPMEARAEQSILALNYIEPDGQKITAQEIKYKAGEFN